MIQIALTQPQFDAAAAKLKADGIVVTGVAGSIQHDGVILGWAYDGATLSVNILKRPWLITAGEIETKVRGWFATS